MKNLNLAVVAALFLVLVILQNIHTYRILNTGSVSEKKTQYKESSPESIIAVADVDYNPFSFIGANGEPAGFDVELIELISDKIGKNIQVKLMPWGQAVDAFDRKEADILLGLEYSPSISPKCLYSVPIVSDEFVAFGKIKINSFGDFYNYRIATIENSSLFERVIEPFSLNENTTFYPSYIQAFESVADGTNDFVFSRKSVGKYYARQTDSSIKITGETIMKNRIVLAVQLDNNALLYSVNNAISELEKNRTIKKLSKKWLGASREIRSVDNNISKYNKIITVTFGAIFCLFLFQFIFLNVSKEKK